MRQCWPDGDLRAFIDRELPADDLARLSAHLEECPQCTLRCRELSVRAVRVQELVGGLPVPVARPLGKPMLGKPIGTPRPHAGRWVAVAAALAAGWAALALLNPKPVQAPPHDIEVHVQPPAAAAPVLQPLADRPVPPQPLPVRAPNRVVPHPIQRVLPAAPQRATLASFVALDDDPIDAGVVMRVALGEGKLQADVIYSPDGRPRAIRLVNDATGK
jgi:hypothetical protein